MTEGDTDTWVAGSTYKSVHGTHVAEAMGMCIVLDLAAHRQDHMRLYPPLVQYSTVPSLLLEWNACQVRPVGVCYNWPPSKL